MEHTKKIVQMNTENGPQQFEATTHKPRGFMYWMLRLGDGMFGRKRPDPFDVARQMLERKEGEQG